MSFSSGSGPIASAFVEVTANTGAANTSIELLIKNLRRIDDVAREVSISMAESFKAAAIAAQTAIRNIDDGHTFENLALQAKLASEQIDNIALASIESSAALTEIDNAADLGLLTLEAELASEAIDEIRNAAIEASIALDEVNNAADFGSLAASALVADESIDAISRSALRASVSLGVLNASFHSLGLIGGAVLAALGAATGAAGLALAGYSVQQAGLLEQVKVSFKTLTGSAEVANQFVNEILKLSAVTPFEFIDLAKEAQNLLGFSKALGLTREEILPTLSTIGDLTSALGQPIDAVHRVVRALGQMGAAGRLNAQDIRQITEALPGFDAWGAIAGEMGITTEALRDMSKKGLVPAEQAIDALLRGMQKFPGAAGAMAAQSQTLIGLFSTFKDVLNITLIQAFQPLADQVRGALIPLTTVIGETLSSVAPAISKFALALFNGIVPIIKELTPGVTNFFNLVGDAIGILQGSFGNIGSIIGGVLEIVGHLFLALSPLIVRFLGEIDALLPIFVTLAKLISSLMTALSPLFQTMADLAGLFGDTLAPILNDISDLFNTILTPAIKEAAIIFSSALRPALQKLAPIITAVGSAFKDRFAEVLKAIAPVLPELAESFAELAVALADLTVAVTPLLIPLLQLETLFIKNLAAPAIQAIAKAIAALARGLATLVATNAAKLKQQIDFIVTSVDILVKKVQEFIDNAKAMIPQVVFEKITQLRDFLFELKDTITNTFNIFKDNTLNEAGPKFDTFAQIITNFRDRFRELYDFIKDKVQPIFDEFRTRILEPTERFINERVIPALRTLKDTISDVANTFQTNGGNALIAFRDKLLEIGNTLGTLATERFEIFKTNVSDLATFIQTVGVTAFENLKTKIGELGTFLTTEIQGAFVTFRDQSLTPFLFIMQTEFTSAFDTAKMKLSEFRTEMVDTLKPAINDFIETGIKPLIAQFQVTLGPELDNLKTKLVAIKDTILLNLGPEIDNLKQKFNDLKDTILLNLGPQLDSLKQKLHDIWVTISTNLLPKTEETSTFIGGTVTPNIQGFSKSLEDNHDIIKDLLTPTIFGLRVALAGLDITLGAVKVTLNVFKFEIDQVGRALGFGATFIDMFKTALMNAGGVVDAIKGTFNGFIGVIDRVIGAIMRLSDMIRNIPKPSLPSLPFNIPGFASGGIITSDTLAQLHAPEVVIPLNDPRRARQLIAASGLMDIISGSNLGGSGGAISSGAGGSGLTVGTVNVNISGNVTPEVVRDAATSFVDTMEEAVARRQLAFTVRTVR